MSTFKLVMPLAVSILALLLLAAPSLSAPSMHPECEGFAPPPTEPAAQSAADLDPIYLNFAGIKGTSTDAAHQGWVLVKSFQWGVGRGSESVNAGHDMASGVSAGKRQWKPLTIVKQVDSASPLLKTAFAQSTHFPTAVIEVVKPGTNGPDIHTYTLTDVVITSRHVLPRVSSYAGNENPTESLSFTFTKITATHNGKPMASDDWR